MLKEKCTGSGKLLQQVIQIQCKHCTWSVRLGRWFYKPRSPPLMDKAGPQTSAQRATLPPTSSKHHADYRHILPPLLDHNHNHNHILVTHCLVAHCLVASIQNCTHSPTKIAVSLALSSFDAPHTTHHATPSSLANFELPLIIHSHTLILLP